MIQGSFSSKSTTNLCKLTGKKNEDECLEITYNDMIPCLANEFSDKALHQQDNYLMRVSKK